MDGIQKLAAEIAGSEGVKSRIGLSPIIVAILIEMLPVLLNELFKRCQEPDTPQELKRTVISGGPLRKWQAKRLNIAACDFDEDVYDDLGRGFGEIVLRVIEDASDDELTDLMQVARKRRRRRIF